MQRNPRTTTYRGACHENWVFGINWWS